MKLTTLLAVTALISLSACQGTRHAVQIGGASLDEAYEPTDDQVTLGWAMTKAVPTNGFGYEVGVQAGAAFDRVGSVDLRSTNIEVWGGPRYEFVLENVRPYLTGGLSLLSTELEASSGAVSVSDKDSGIGLYAGGGVDFDISDNLYLGIGLRQTFGHEAQLFGVDVDGDFSQVFLRFGGRL